MEQNQSRFHGWKTRFYIDYRKDGFAIVFCFGWIIVKFYVFSWRIIETLKRFVSKKDNDKKYFCFSPIRLLVLVHNCWTLKKSGAFGMVNFMKVVWKFTTLLTITILEHCKWYLLDLTVPGPLGPTISDMGPLC